MDWFMCAAIIVLALHTIVHIAAFAIIFKRLDRLERNR